jgi:hypothetical protein
MKSKEFITEISIDGKEMLHDIAKEHNLKNTTLANITKIVTNYHLQLSIIEPMILIARNCQPYIQEMNGEIYSLLRGMNEHQTFIKKRVRLNDRTPMAMSLRLQKTMNEYFSSQFGSPFRNAALCTGDHNHAQIFGTVFSVFPIGEYQYLWSPDIADVNWAYGAFRTNYQFDYADSNELDTGFMKNVIADATFRTIDLSVAIASEKEIMLRCNSYYGVSNDIIKDFTPEQFKGMNTIIEAVIEG